ncbi:MAG: 4'-phosphopantetheinyl transferase superfamily protein [Desulfuromonadaceae bacterium]|nr:4'-phosphopantetheinyl transferase superfamily protein [Desulfuromonadaceae bacterium]
MTEQGDGKMEVNVVSAAKDRQGVTVHSMHPVYQRGPVFYASLPHDFETAGGYGTNAEEIKHRLVSTLWEHLLERESPLWKSCQSSSRTALPIQVVSGLLGRPRLLVGKSRGPAISFTEGGGKVWAALCGDESDIGIDVAGGDEFKGAYPFHRVFHPEEFHHALRLADEDPEEASALLWSVKEAVVKALGCGFHLMDPRHLNVYPSGGRIGGGYSFQVDLSGKALERFPTAAGRSLWVRSLPQKKMWFSIAILRRRPALHE